ncbi:MAG: hypothetical protein JXR76_06310 [Deltaproteobacteria bacterium]|nr:hypothetical protein [Deltaproteobacteria bacterium]
MMQAETESMKVRKNREKTIVCMVKLRLITGDLSKKSDVSQESKVQWNLHPL